MTKDSFCNWCQREVSRCQVNWFGTHIDTGTELIHCVEAGVGDPLVLIHGFMAWSYSWRHNLSALAESHRVIAPDLRGFGLSEKSGQRSHSIAHQVEVIKDLLDALGIESAVLCGHSMGGEVALRFALKYPARVRALVVVSSSGYVQRQGAPLERLLLRMPGLGHLFVRAVVLNRRFATQTLRAAYRVPEKVQETDVDAYLLPARAPGAAAAFVRMVRDMDLGQASGELHRIRRPALLIWGENDPWMQVDMGKRMAKEIAGSRLVVFPECGHVPQEEYPEEFNRTVLTFLASLPVAVPHDGPAP